MATVAELVAEGAATLPVRSGIPDPRREARWLLAAALGVAELALSTDPDRLVPAAAETTFREWLARRAAGEPAEHLVGRCRFWGRWFEVTPAVLVPRPETELLVEVALALPVGRQARVLDVGAGSGCLAATLALERPGWRVVAVDRSPAALAVARRNLAALGAAVGLVLGDLASACGPPFDLVVANLPYVKTADLAALPLEVRHDPVGALDGGADGLDLLRRLLADLPRLLRPCGGAVLELGEDQAEAVAELGRSRRLAVARRVRDVAGVERVVVLQPTG